MNTAPDDVQWWGYLHANGTVQLKRWLGDFGDARESPFVQKIVEPFPAPNRTSAYLKLVEKLS
jgi:hypothetical protein